jgi:allantoicase
MPAKKKTAPKASKAAKPIPAILIAYSESDFTNPHEAMLATEPKDCRGDFTHMGAKYWGFESRRHMATTVVPGSNELAYDHNAHGWMLIGLKKRGKIDKITISTKWYTGNQVRAVSVYLTDELTGTAAQVLHRQPLKPDSEHVFNIKPVIATQAYVEVYYEGGLSRINFFGDTGIEQPPERKNLLDGAKITHVSNIHYGVPDRCVGGDRQQMHMYGWESARTGCGEQALFHLKKPAVIDEVIVDTYLHRLNAPLTAHVFAVNAKGQDINKLMKQAPKWSAVFDGKKVVVPDNFGDYMMNQKYLKEKGVKNNEQFTIRLNIPKGCPWKAVMPFEPLSPDTWHRFRDVNDVGPVTHVLYMHYDNGGIHGLKVYGTEKK